MFPGSIRIFVGDQHTVAVPEGHELIAARVVNGATVVTPTVTAGPDGADFRPTELGRYYLRTRKDATENWCNAGCWRSCRSRTKTTRRCAPNWTP